MTPTTSHMPATPVDSGAAVEATADNAAQRQRIIDDIRRLNPTASASFLAEFNTESLRDYLEHLQNVRNKHVRLPGWVQRRTEALAEARRQLGRVA